jgi:hypothetical protein
MIHWGVRNGDEFEDRHENVTDEASFAESDPCEIGENVRSVEYDGDKPKGAEGNMRYDTGECNTEVSDAENDFEGRRKNSKENDNEGRPRSRRCYCR